MSIRLTKPWIPLADLAEEAIPAQLGVFQLADDEGTVLHIGYGGGRQPFGLRTAVTMAVERSRQEGWGPPTRLRYEVTHGYLSRWQELLMVHQHDIGAPPPGNPDGDRPKGRLTPAPSAR